MPVMQIGPRHPDCPDCDPLRCLRNQGKSKDLRVGKIDHTYNNIDDGSILDYISTHLLEKKVNDSLLPRPLRRR